MSPVAGLQAWRWARPAVALALLVAAIVPVRDARALSPPQTIERRCGPVVLVAPPGAEGVLENLAPRAQSMLNGVSQKLGIEPAAPFTMLLIPVGGLRDTALARFDHDAPIWAAGYMQPALRRGAIRLALAARYPFGTPAAVFVHETAHQLIHDAPGVEVPLWFNEGVATWVAREWQFEDLFQVSSKLMWHDLPRLDDLDAKFHGNELEVGQAYATSFSFVLWSTRRYGDRVVRDVLGEARTHSFERAWQRATGLPLDRAEADWHRDSLMRFRWVPLITTSTTFWLIAMGLMALAWIRKRRRARLLEAAWANDDEWEVIEGTEAPADEGSVRQDPEPREPPPA